MKLGLGRIHLNALSCARSLFADRTSVYGTTARPFLYTVWTSPWFLDVHTKVSSTTPALAGDLDDTLLPNQPEHARSRANTTPVQVQGPQRRWPDSISERGPRSTARSGSLRRSKNQRTPRHAAHHPDDQLDQWYRHIVVDGPIIQGERSMCQAHGTLL